MQSVRQGSICEQYMLAPFQIKVQTILHDGGLRKRVAQKGTVLCPLFQRETFVILSSGPFAAVHQPHRDIDTYQNK